MTTATLHPIAKLYRMELATQDLAHRLYTMSVQLARVPDTTPESVVSCRIMALELARLSRGLRELRHEVNHQLP